MGCSNGCCIHKERQNRNAHLKQDDKIVRGRVDQNTDNDLEYSETPGGIHYGQNDDINEYQYRMITDNRNSIKIVSQKQLRQSIFKQKQIKKPTQNVHEQFHEQQNQNNRMQSLIPHQMYNQMEKANYPATMEINRIQQNKQYPQSSTNQEKYLSFVQLDKNTLMSKINEVNQDMEYTSNHSDFNHIIPEQPITKLANHSNYSHQLYSDINIMTSSNPSLIALIQKSMGYQHQFNTKFAPPKIEFKL